MFGSGCEERLRWCLRRSSDGGVSDGVGGGVGRGGKGGKVEMSVWSEWKCVLDALPARAELAPLAPMVGRCLSQGGLVVRMFSRFWMFAMFGLFEMLEMFWKLAPSSRRARAELAPVVLVVGSEGLVEVGLSLFHPTSRRPSSIHTSTTPTTQVTTIFHQG